MDRVSPPGLVATRRPSSSRTTHGGLIQLSGLYALASACTAIEPSAFNMMRRGAAGSRAPSRPWYSTEQFATSTRTLRVVPHPCAPAALGVRCRSSRLEVVPMLLANIDGGFYKFVLVLHIF